MPDAEKFESQSRTLGDIAATPGVDTVKDSRCCWSMYIPCTNPHIQDIKHCQLPKGTLMPLPNQHFFPLPAQTSTNLLHFTTTQPCLFQNYTSSHAYNMSSFVFGFLTLACLFGFINQECNSSSFIFYSSVVFHYRNTQYLV